MSDHLSAHAVLMEKSEREDRNLLVVVGCVGLKKRAITYFESVQVRVLRITATETCLLRVPAAGDGVRSFAVGEE